MPAQLIVAGDVAATVGRIAAAEPLFRLGIAAEYVILLREVALCVLLYVLFRQSELCRHRRTTKLQSRRWQA